MTDTSVCASHAKCSERFGLKCVFNHVYSSEVAYLQKARRPDLHLEGTDIKYLKCCESIFRQESVSSFII